MVAAVPSANAFAFSSNIISHIGRTTAPTILMPWIPNDHNKWIKNIGNKTPSRLFPKILVKGSNNDNKAAFTSKPATLRINQVVVKITAPGINASKLRATAGGTCSGILIVILRFLKKRYTSTAKIMDRIPANIPDAPKELIGKTQPRGASSGVKTFTGTCNIKNVPSDNIPPVTLSNPYDLARSEPITKVA